MHGSPVSEATVGFTSRMQSAGKGTARPRDQREPLQRLDRGLQQPSPTLLSPFHVGQEKQQGKYGKTASWDVVGSAKEISKQHLKQQNQLARGAAKQRSHPTKGTREQASQATRQVLRSRFKSQ